MPAFLAQATQPDGTLAQIGDTFAVAPLTDAATTYAASKGTTGTAPTQRVAIYSPSGFIFGRSTWSPFTSASFYSLRFGPKVDQHGHNDRTALTWMLAGKHRLVDAGHVGYTNTTVRTWLRTPEAHNLLSADQYVGFRLATGAQAKGSSLRYSRTSSRADSFVVDAQAYAWNTASTGWHWTSQRRSVLVARGPDLLVVRDTAGGAPKAVTWRQHWHVPPGWTAVHAAL